MCSIRLATCVNARSSSDDGGWSRGDSITDLRDGVAGVEAPDRESGEWTGSAVGLVVRVG